MAHEIDMTTGKAAVFVTGQAAWHKLGTVVTDCQKSADAIKLAGLDWQVTKEPVFQRNAANEYLPIPNSFANVRQDTQAVLGVVGSSYRPFQNSEAFDFMDDLIGEKLAMFETAGSLKGGKRVWVMARIPGEYRVAKDDIVKPYVLITNGHDGCQAIRMIPTTVRVVCQNTLNLAMGRAGSDEGISIMHNESADARLVEARQKFGLISHRLSAFEEQAKAMAKKSLNQEQLAKFFSSLVEGRSVKSQKTQIETWFEKLHNERNGMPGIRASVWSAFNSVSEYADHDIRGAGADDHAKLDSRLNSMWFGASHQLKTKAFAAAFALVA